MTETMHAEFRVFASYYDRLRFWLHGVRYSSILTQLANGNIEVACTCGGGAVFEWLDDRSVVVTSSCRRWTRLGELQRATIPRARASR